MAWVSFLDLQYLHALFQNIPLFWPYLPNYFTCNADPTILCFYCPFCSVLPPSVPISRIANNLSCLLFISFISMMKYILEIKPTGDQDSAASNCFNVGGCMIRVVCFTQNLYSKRKKNGVGKAGLWIMPIFRSLSRSKPSLTIAPEFGKTIGKPLISMVDL